MGKGVLKGGCQKQGSTWGQSSQGGPRANSYHTTGVTTHRAVRGCALRSTQHARGRGQQLSVHTGGRLLFYYDVESCGTSVHGQ